ncbi:RHS repeat-associated core domain-containing protein, partial [Dysgonomonas reticulitermitis]
MLTLQRYGKKDTGNAATSYGLVDNLTMDHIGNQLTKVTDAVPNFVYIESADFKDYSNAATEYTYNRNGAMKSDLNKGITEIQYN